MSKNSGIIIVVSVVLLVVLLFLLTETNQNPNRGLMNDFESEGINELGLGNVNSIYVSEKNIPEEDLKQDSLGNLQYTVRADMGQIEGTLSDAHSWKGLQGVSVSVYCDGRIISGSDAQTDSSGYFYVINDGSCSLGEELWIEINYHNNKFESKHITIPGNMIG